MRRSIDQRGVITRHETRSRGVRDSDARETAMLAKEERLTAFASVSSFFLSPSALSGLYHRLVAPSESKALVWLSSWRIGNLPSLNPRGAVELTNSGVRRSLISHPM